MSGLNHACMGKGCTAVSQGWENGARLRFCFRCSVRYRDCRGDPLDYSPDSETDWRLWMDAGMARTYDAAKALRDPPPGVK